jgi:hypothetical protein
MKKAEQTQDKTNNIQSTHNQQSSDANSNNLASFNTNIIVIDGAEFDEFLCEKFDLLSLKPPSASLLLSGASAGLVEMRESLFDELFPSYEKIKQETIDTIVDHCFWEIESRSRNYKREK